MYAVEVEANWLVPLLTSLFFGWTVCFKNLFVVCRTTASQCGWTRWAGTTQNARTTMHVVFTLNCRMSICLLYVGWQRASVGGHGGLGRCRMRGRRDLQGYSSIYRQIQHYKGIFVCISNTPLKRLIKMGSFVNILERFWNTKQIVFSVYCLLQQHLKKKDNISLFINPSLTITSKDLSQISQAWDNLRGYRPS